MSLRTAIAIIPARYGSTRLPGKPLVQIQERTLIEHVYRRVECAKLVGQIVVATDDRRIFETVERFGGKALMTRGDHASGTDRLAEAAKDLDPETIVVNVQGDEPLIEPSAIDRAVSAMGNRDADIVTLRTRLDDVDLIRDTHRVKVVVDRNGFALYFSRSPIPSHGPCFLHIGLYCYRAGFLRKLAALERTPLEIAERLEQLRALEHGYRIQVVEVESQSWGVDTPADVERLEKLLGSQHV